MQPKPSNSMWTDEQWEAISIRNTNVLVSAGAGSGKTAVLSERVLELVRSGVDVDSLIVLTFTNAAAAEMKERIRLKLEQAAVSDPEIHKNLEKIDRSFIMTFDSFCLYLVKKYNYMLNINQNISIIDNITASSQKYKIFRSVLETFVANQNQSIIEFIATYSATSIDEIISLCLSWYDKSIQKMSEFKISSPIQISQMYEQLVIDKQNEIKNIIIEITNLGSDTALPEKISERCDVFINAQGYDQIKSGIDAIFETRLWQLPRGEYDNKEILRSLNDTLKTELKSLQKLSTRSSAENIKLLEQNNNTKKLINDLINTFKSRFYEYKRENGLFEFIDINLMAIQILEENSEIAEQLNNSVYEIMIDEYQDTNDIQEKFVSLIANNNLYMVGDIKQSIYGFRNANPDLFAQKYNDYQTGTGGKLITLTNNFRSRESVLVQVNEFFEKVMSDSYGGINYDHNQKMKYGNKSYDLLKDTNFNEVLTYDSDEIAVDRNDYEIVQIFKDISSKIENKYQVVDGNNSRPVKLSDFAIICATRTNFERIVKIGEYFNISVNADIQEQFTTASEIIVIQSALNVLNCIKKGNDQDRKFTYSVMVLARSYLFNYTDDEIDQAITILNKIGSDQISKKIYSLEKGTLQKLGSILNKLALNIDLKSNSFILSEIIEKFGVVENLHRLSNPFVRQMRISRFVELIDEYDKRNYNLDDICIIANEIERNDDLDIEFNSNSDLETDSVTVITTHKSKGLEYNICYFPFLFKRFNAIDINSRFGFTGELEYILPSKLENGNLTNTIEKYIWNEKSTRELISEKIRLFYVAITRAKDKNILLVDINKIDKQVPINKANSLQHLLFANWDSISKYKVEGYQLTKDDIEACNLNKFDKDIKSDCANKVVPKYLDLDIEISTIEKRRASGQITEQISKSVSKNIELGNEIHEKLEFCDLQNIGHEISNATGPFKIALTSIKNSGLLNGMLNFYPEFQFNYLNNGEINGIIDLLVETEDAFIIIDYKLNAIEKVEYESQVKTYIDYIESITEKNVKGYLLSLLSGDVKEIKK